MSLVQWKLGWNVWFDVVMRRTFLALHIEIVKQFCRYNYINLMQSLVRISHVSVRSCSCVAMQSRNRIFWTFLISDNNKKCNLSFYLYYWKILIWSYGTLSFLLFFTLLIHRLSCFSFSLQKKVLLFLPFYKNTKSIYVSRQVSVLFSCFF
jgi:hypothetical protein